MASMNLSLTGRGDLKRMSAILEQMTEQQNERIAETIELAKTSPVPWPTELMHRISFTMNDDFDEVTTHHPGHKIFNTHESIKLFLDLFDDTYKELEKAIQHYHVSYKDTEFFSRRGRDKHDRAIFDLNRCIFNFTSAGDALRNIRMRQEKHYKPQGYEVTVPALRNTVVVIYRGDGQALVKERILILHSIGGQGAKRPWFECPDCKRRIAVLYKGDNGFRCRQCYGREPIYCKRLELWQEMAVLRAAA